MKKCIQLSILSLTLLFAGNAWAVICYVSPGGSGTADGSSWQNAKPFASAIVAPAASTEFYFMAGVYNLPPATSWVALSNSSLYGGFMGHEMSLAERNVNDPYNKTIFNGDIDGIHGPSVGDVAPLISIVSSINVKIDGIVFQGANNEAGNGGAVSASSGAVVNIANCVFRNNRADKGAGIFALDADVKVVNSLFYGNDAPNPGSAVYFEASGSNFFKIYGSTIVKNMGDPVVANAPAPGGELWVKGSIIYFNSGVKSINNMGGGTIYSDYICYDILPEGTAPTSSISADPLFRGVDDTTVGPFSPFDFELQNNFDNQSPCIDSSHENGIGSDGTDMDGDADFGEFTPRDFNGAPRQMGGAPDIGCFETEPTIFVSPAGSDANTGGAATPVQTIAKAVSMVSGPFPTRVLLQAGPDFNNPIVYQVTAPITWPSAAQMVWVESSNHHDNGTIRIEPATGQAHNFANIVVPTAVSQPYRIGFAGMSFDNFGTSGHGGLFSVSGPVNLELDHCYVSNSSATGNGGVVYADYSGVMPVSGPPIEIGLFETEFFNNSANNGGALYVKGIAAASEAPVDFVSGALQNSPWLTAQNLEYVPYGVYIESSKFIDNSGQFAGGAVVTAGNIDLKIARTKFSGNSVTQPGGVGGAVNASAPLMLHNSLFEGNSADRVGAVAVAGLSSVSQPQDAVIAHTTVVQNSSVQPSEAVVITGGIAKVVNSIFFDNGGANIAHLSQNGSNNNLSIDYSAMQPAIPGGYTGGAANVDILATDDPFVDSVAGNWSLRLDAEPLQLLNGGVDLATIDPKWVYLQEHDLHFNPFPPPGAAGYAMGAFQGVGAQGGTPADALIGLWARGPMAFNSGVGPDTIVTFFANQTYLYWDSTTKEEYGNWSLDGEGQLVLNYVGGFDANQDFNLAGVDTTIGVDSLIFDQEGASLVLQRVMPIEGDNSTLAQGAWGEGLQFNVGVPDGGMVVAFFETGNYFNWESGPTAAERGTELGSYSATIGTAPDEFSPIPASVTFTVVQDNNSGSGPSSQPSPVNVEFHGLDFMRLDNEEDLYRILGVGGYVSYVDPNNFIFLSEDGTVKELAFKLPYAPDGPVTLDLSILDPSDPTYSTPLTGEVELLTTSLSFTTANWDQPQTIQLRAIVDGVIDGDKDFMLAIVSTATNSTDNYFDFKHGVPGRTIDIDAQLDAVVVDPYGTGGALSLDQAIAAAASGDTIKLLYPGTYSVSEVVVDKSLTIVGFDPQRPELTVITPKSTGRFMTVVTTPVESLHFVGLRFEGFSHADGGGVFAFSQPVNVAISNCQFVGNSSTNTSTVDEIGGGVLYQTGGSLTINKTLFKGNYAASEGAVIAVANSEVYIGASRFVENTAAIEASAIISDNCRIAIVGCGFAKNHVEATSYTFEDLSSVISLLNSPPNEAKVENSLFVQNSSSLVLCEESEGILINNCTFASNFNESLIAYPVKLYDAPVTVALRNSVLWQNGSSGDATQISFLGSGVSAADLTQLGNWTSDPSFVNAVAVPYGPLSVPSHGVQFPTGTPHADFSTTVVYDSEGYDYSVLDYALTADSAAIGSADVATAAAYELHGLSRSLGDALRDPGAFELLSSVGSFQSQAGATVNDYRMFGPNNLDPDRPIWDQLVENLGPYDITVWRLFRWNPATQSYDEGEAIEGIKEVGNERAASFWLITAAATSLQFNGEPANQYGDTLVELQPGWNMVGNPYVEALDVAAGIKVQNSAGNFVSLSSTENDAVQQNLYQWNGSVYVDLLTLPAADQKINAFGGFWLYNSSTTPLGVIITGPAAGAEGGL